MKRIALILAVAAFACRREPKVVEVLTTPGTAATELPQRLTSEFSRQTGVQIRLRVVTPEQIDAAAKKGTEIAIYRDPALDQTLGRERLMQLRSAFAFEDFALIGPHRDPAHVRGAPSAPEAFRRIAARKRRFCSAVDIPLLRSVEMDIWSAAAVDPHTNRGYKACHGDVAELIDRCDDRDAYTVVTRSAADAMHKRGLDVVLRDVPMLHHEYIVTLLRPPSTNVPKNAAWFVEWVMSYRGREVIRSLDRFSVPGE